jgi:hypothetical protein
MRALILRSPLARGHRRMKKSRETSTVAQVGAHTPARDD